MRYPRLQNIQEDADHDEQQHDLDERASLLTTTSVTAPSNTPAAASITTASQSHFDLLEDDDDDDWEDISLPTPPLKDRIIYCLCWTLPILLYDALRLGLFVLLLAPAFFQFVWYYAIAADRQVIGYTTATDSSSHSSSMRRVVDVYGACKNNEGVTSRKPVVIFFTGGAWMVS